MHAIICTRLYDMATVDGNNIMNGPHEDLVRCSVCDVYFEKEEGFRCPKCRRGPLCKKHRVTGRRECVSCLFDRRLKELQALKGQETSIKNFLLLLQFIFLVFAIFFISVRMGLAEEVDFLQNTIMVDNLIYVGIIPVLGFLLFYGILYNQKKKIVSLETEMKKIKFRKQV